MRKTALFPVLAFLILPACDRKDESSSLDRLIGGSEAPAAVPQSPEQDESQKEPASQGPIDYAFKGTTTDGRQVRGTLTVTPTITQPGGAAPSEIYTFPVEIELTVGNELHAKGVNVYDVYVKDGHLGFNEFSVRLNGAHNGLIALALTFDQTFTKENLAEQLTRLGDMTLLSASFLINSYDGPDVNIEGTLTKIKKGKDAAI